MKELAVLTPEDKMIVTQTRMIWGFQRFFEMVWQSAMAGRKSAKRQQNRAWISSLISSGIKRIQAGHG